MRAAVISDIHANLHALDAVLERIEEEGVDALYVLGDIVGYGGDPVAVLQRLRGRSDAVLLAGNHDLAAVGRFDATWFNSVARTAIEWTAGVLGDEREILLALEPRAEAGGSLLVHGSVVDPAAEYVTNIAIAAASFVAEDFHRCFFGHTHIPKVFTEQDGEVEGRSLGDGELVRLAPGGPRVMLNPGSVGQPRDGDPRASFMVVDDDAGHAIVHRVAYDIAGAQARIRAEGLPDVLADRLSAGR